LINQRLPGLQRLTEELNLSTGYVYGLLNLIDMAEKVAERPENALWHAYFAYRTARMLEKRKLTAEQCKRRQEELAEEIAHLGIEKYGADYRIALFSYLYQYRD